MNIKNYMQRGVAVAVITAASMAYTPNASADFSLKEFAKTPFKLVAGALSLPYKVIDSSKNELNPVAGARRWGVDLLETAVLGVTGHKSVSPIEYGAVNETIDEIVPLKLVVDIGLGAVLGGGIGALVQTVDEMASDSFKKTYDSSVYSKGKKEFTEAEHYAKSGGDKPFGRRSSKTSEKKLRIN